MRSEADIQADAAKKVLEELAEVEHILKESDFNENQKSAVESIYFSLSNKMIQRDMHIQKMQMASDKRALNYYISMIGLWTLLLISMWMI